MPAVPSRFPAVRFGTELLFVIFVLLSVLAAVLVSLELRGMTDADWAGRRPLLTLLASGIALGLTAVLLRRFDVADLLSRLAFLVFWFGNLGMSAVSAIAAFGPRSADTYLVMPQLSDRTLLVVNVAYTVLGIIVWNLLTTDTTAYRNIRLGVRAAHKDSFPNAQWNRTVGAPGRSMLNLAGENSMSARRTAIAQQLMAPLLDELLSIPGVTIVHGLRSPAHPEIVIGHAVVSGGRIALLDPVLWEPATYRLDSSGRVLRNGLISEEHTTALPIVMDDLAEGMPGAPIRAWLTVLPTTDGELHTSTERPDSLVTLGTPSSTLGEVGDWLAGDGEGEYVNVFALQMVMRHRLG
ncbi:hypothetical protein [Cryobacterium sp. BB307]|uniref:hypothetical protein n=1 Tax=Cryobacterium sp. BB307 TaxID=2716317 RepID=UPI001444E456|nr:hypothetical protein [Cryobacterium sp. BB307]